MLHFSTTAPALADSDLLHDRRLQLWVHAVQGHQAHHRHRSRMLLGGGGVLPTRIRIHS
jgi:hypothetical protein